MGAPLLRELARQPEMAAARTLREVHRDDRPSLGRHRRLLPAGEQGLARLRRRPQQQDPRPPAPRLRPARPRISPPESAHMHAAGALNTLKSPTRSPDEPFLFCRSAPLQKLL